MLALCVILFLADPFNKIKIWCDVMKTIVCLDRPKI